MLDPHAFKPLCDAGIVYGVPRTQYASSARGRPLISRLLIFAYDVLGFVVAT